MINLKLTILLGAIVFFQWSTFAQDWTSFESQKEITELVDTGNELLMATHAGLVVMNKSTLDKTIFNTGNTNLIDNHIQSITQAPNGDIWIGTEHVNLQRFDGTDFHDLTVPVGGGINGNTELFAFEVAPNGDFWCGTSKGIFQRQGTVWSHLDATDLGTGFFQPWDIAINDSGEVFIGSNDVFKFANGTWTNTSTGSTLQGYLGADFLFNSNGDLFFAGDLDEIGRFDGTQWQLYAIDASLNGSEIHGFAEDSNGDMYFRTTTDGLFKLVNTNWVLQNDAQALAVNNEISFFYIDPQGGRWLNSNIHLSLSTNGNIQSTLISQHTLESNSIRNVRQGNNGVMYFINFVSKNIAVVDPNENWTLLPYPTGMMPFEALVDILFISENNIWIATHNGLYQYNGTSWTFTSLEPCIGLAIDSQGKIYVRALDRIYSIENGVFSEYNVSNSPLSAAFLAGHGIDAADNLWIAEGDGVNSIHQVTAAGSWTTFTAADHPVINNPNGDFHFAGNGDVWIPSSPVGAIKFDGTNFTNPYIGNIDLMANYKALSVESDQTGKMYFSHPYGVTTLLNEQWEDLLIDAVPNTNSSVKSKITFDDKGNLWWGNTGHGVFVIQEPCPPKMHTVKNAVDAEKNSLRVIVQESCKGDTIVFDSNLDGLVQVLGTERISVIHDLVFIGNGTTSTIISGGNLHQIFNIATDVKVHLEDLSLRDASATINGGAFENDGFITLKNIHLSNNMENGIPKPFTNHKSLEILAGTVKID